VRPLRRALAGAAAWITGLRRGQAAGRGGVPFAVWDAEHGLVKVNPLADWTLGRVEAYVAANGVPVNPLHARGFPSIGCQPCTRAVRPGEDIRAGRWWWEIEDGKECGLHNNPRRPAAAKAEAPA
jgi:phosphoadenosine phosphosulfate reductase